MPSVLDEALQIISVDDVIIALGLHESHYARIESLVNSVSARVESYTHNRFKKRAFNLTKDGSPSMLLDLGAVIVSVASAQLGDTVLSESAGDFQVLNERGELFRSSGWLGKRGNRPTGIRAVLVTATLGHDPIPHEVKEAVLVVIKAWHFGAGGGGGLGGSLGGYQSERIGDYAYTRFGSSGGAAAFFGVGADIGEAVAALLSPYVRHGF